MGAGSDFAINENGCSFSISQDFAVFVNRENFFRPGANLGGSGFSPGVNTFNVEDRFVGADVGVGIGVDASRAAVALIVYDFVYSFEGEIYAVGIEVEIFASEIACGEKGLIEYEDGIEVITTAGEGGVCVCGMEGGPRYWTLSDAHHEEFCTIDFFGCLDDAGRHGDTDGEFLTDAPLAIPIEEAILFEGIGDGVEIDVAGTGDGFDGAERAVRCVAETFAVDPATEVVGVVRVIVTVACDFAIDGPDSGRDACVEHEWFDD